MRSRPWLSSAYHFHPRLYPRFKRRMINAGVPFAFLMSFSSFLISTPPFLAASWKDCPRTLLSWNGIFQCIHCAPRGPRLLLFSFLSLDFFSFLSLDFFFSGFLVFLL